MRWSEDVPIVIYDAEQANALSFLLARTLAFERPIFHYNEYAIRCGEFLVGIGRIDSGMRMGQAARHWLRKYAAATGTSPYVSRPLYAEALESVIKLETYVVSSFLLGHEIGHSIAQHPIGGDSQHCEVEKRWRQLNPVDADGIKTMRFTRPFIVQKFSAGQPNGIAHRGVKLMAVFERVEKAMIEECIADFYALLLSSMQALRFDIEPALLITAITELLESSNRQLLLRTVRRSSSKRKQWCN